LAIRCALAPLPAMAWLRCCSRRQAQFPLEKDTAFWEEAPLSKAGAAEDDECTDPPLGYEQAAHLKDDGNEKFARGDTAEAMEVWSHALDALCMPQDPPEPDSAPSTRPLADDERVRELRLTLLSNMSLGHKKLKQWRQAVSYCDEVLLEQSANVKALYRKADCLGELGAWREAEEAAARLDAAGKEGAKLAQQKRDEWKRRRKVADGKQKKMWSTAISESNSAELVKKNTRNSQETHLKNTAEPWDAPLVLQMSVFDLRRKGIEWVEGEDFDDAVWRDGIGFHDAVFYQKRALPLTFLAAVALANVDLQSDLVVHCLLDGNIAPFAEPHDWSMVLQRCPGLRTLTVVYIDFGAIGDGAPPPMPYGQLLRPTEEGRVGDRVARVARFLGTYREFKEHCRELPGLVDPQLALWADVPLYGFGDSDLATRVEAYELLAAAMVPSVVTQGGEIPGRGGPPMASRVSDQASSSMAILSEGLGAATMADWHWNRFVVPLDRGSQGIVAAHALLGVLRPAVSRNSPAQVRSIKDALTRRGVMLVPYKLPELANLSNDEELDRLRKRQWEAFCETMRAAGRPVGMEADEQERHRQSMEFYQLCGISEPPPL